MPWAATFRELKRQRFWMDCDSCKKNPHVRRARMRCGWISSDDWEVQLGDMVPEIAIVQADITRPSVCPGYSIQLPEVIEIARAYGWLKHGQLWFRHPDASEEFLDLVELFNQERAAAESYYIEERQRAAK